MLNVATGVGRLDEAELTAWCNNLHLDTALSPPCTLDTWLYQLKHLVPLSTTFFLSLPILSCSWANLSPPSPFVPNFVSDTTLFESVCAHLTNIRSKIISFVPLL